MQKVSLTLRVDAEDLERWKAQSGGNLSEWIRGTLNEAAVENELAEKRSRRNERATPDKRQDRGRQNDSLSDMAGGSSGSSNPGKCPHHKAKGELCYKCDQKFGNPVIG